MIRQVVPLMRQRHSRTIINLSSVAGRVASPFAAAYDATKYAIEGLCESLRFELRLHGIRVKLVEPGLVRTGFIRSVTWATHSAYEPQLGNCRARLAQADDHAPSCERVVRVILRAANDQSWRLRYLVKAGPLPVLHALLPDALFSALLSSALNRPLRGRLMVP